jgi:hypothetical protein
LADAGKTQTALTERPHRRRRHRLEPIEVLTAIHVIVFGIASTWAFGGQAEWVQPPLIAWGSVSALLALAAILRGDQPVSRSLFWWAVPMVLFNGLVLLAAANPSFS